ncbi:aflatoxin regulatory protein-domain-containing protein [Aspergillus desertorum]
MSLLSLILPLQRRYPPSPLISLTAQQATESPTPRFMMTESAPSSSVCSLSSSRRLPNGQQPRKLRDSCIHCANSKVKCNKEKPICGRCVRRRLPCEYKVSRRTGRTSRGIPQLVGSGPAGRTTGTLTISPAIHPANTGGNTASNVLPSNPITRGSPQTPLLTPITPIPTSEPSPEHCVPQSPDFWRSFLSPSAFSADVGDLSSLITTPTDVGNLFGLFGSVMGSPLCDTCDTDSLSAQAMGGSVSATETLLPMPALSDPKSVDTSNTTFNPVKTCLTTVLDVFRNVFANTPMPCKNAAGQRVPGSNPTVESVLSENREAIHTLSIVMDCPCSHNGYILSIISLAVLKAMDWYSAAARGQISAPDDTREWGQDIPMHTGGPKWSLPFDEELSRSPDPVRSCSIEGSQNRLAAQLVLSELHRVQRLVNILASRLENIRLRTCFSPASSFGSNSTDNVIETPLLAAKRILPLSGSTLTQLEDDLRQRLRAVSSETIEILRRT